MTIPCDRCGGATKPKQITAKKDGKKYTLCECIGNCRSGKFAYSFFPPKEAGSSVEAPTSPAVQGSSQTVPLLRSMLTTLQNIEKILANPNKIHVATTELEGDKEIPF